MSFYYDYDNIRKEFDTINEFLKDANNKCINFIFNKQIKELKNQLAEISNPNRMYERMGVDILLIAVSQNLLPVADVLCRELCVLRYSLVDEYGYIIPNVKVVDYNKIPSNNYEIYVRGKKVFVSELSSDDIKNLNSQPIIDSLKNVCFEYVHKVMSKTDALKLIELVKQQHSSLATDTFPNYLTPIDLKNILANLIKDKISIKDIVLIFEILNDIARYTQNIDELTEKLKKELVF